MAIVGCKDKRTERFMTGARVKEYEAFKDEAHESLAAVEAALVLSDLRNPPSNRFEALGGDRKGQYSIRINRKSRVCFRWAPHASTSEGTDPMQMTGDAYDVEIVPDYH
jgi:proteic killer suppression protein